MKNLTDEQIQYGFYYFFRDRNDDISRVTELSEYDGEDELIINCTQLGSDYPQKEKKRVLNEWCDFLEQNPSRFKTLKFGTRMPQELFNAVCKQKNLSNLEIKWGAYKNLSAIENLQDLDFLYIGSGAGVESVTPISKLNNLSGLYIENFQKVQDYSSIASLQKLTSLTLCGDGLGPQYVKVESISFLKEMLQLRFLNLLTIQLKDKNYSPILELTNLEHLSLRSHRDVKRLYSELSTLPKLKWGLLKEKPEIYGK